jgi:hypothetical protein
MPAMQRPNKKAKEIAKKVMKHEEAEVKASKKGMRADKEFKKTIMKDLNR